LINLVTRKIIEMAIKVGAEIQTSEGAVTGLYFHILEFYRNKSGERSAFPVKYYTDDTKTTECKIFEGDLKYVFEFDISAEVTAGTDKIEKIAYDKIGAALLAAGLAPESDETGSWVAYS
jgi:hypothetical protein